MLKKNQKQLGKLYVRYGPMGGNKTTWLVRRYKPGETAVFIPSTDNRSGAALKAHNGMAVIKNVDVVSPHQPNEIIKIVNKLQQQHKITRLLIDEINFFDQSLVKVVEELRVMGKDVYLTGLLLDSDQNDFGPTRQIAEQATDTKIMCAQCDFEQKNGKSCRRPAVFTYFKGQKSGQVVVGAFDLYGASCLKHLMYFRNRYHLPPLKPMINLETVWQVANKLVKEIPIRGKRLAKPNTWPRIEVAADSMRVGKTTAVQVITAGLKKLGYPVIASFEDLQHNPFLKKSYANPSQALLKSQKWFARRKFQQLKAAAKNKVVVQDLSPEGDYAYAIANVRMGRMSLKDFKTYDRYYRKLPWLTTPIPDLLIYLTASDQVLIDRVRRATRKFETVDNKYFIDLKKANREWLQKVEKSSWQVLRIDTDRFNFADEPKQQERLAKLVQDKLVLKPAKATEIRRGELTVIYGPMYSGKTTHLIEICKKTSGYLVFKPDIDDRYTKRPVLRTHDGVEARAIKVNVHQAEEIWQTVQELHRVKPVETVLIDEVNLFDEGLVTVVKRLLQTGINVVTAGILLDSEKGDFGQTSALIALADDQKPLYARCDFPGCTKSAAYSYCKKVKQTQVVVGAADLYGAACEDHYEQLHVPGKSESALPIRQDIIKELINYGVYPAYAEWLRGIKFPKVRKIHGKHAHKYPRIEIGEDGVSTGRVKMVQLLSDWCERQKIPVKVFNQSAEKNPYLKLEYRKKADWLFQAEKWFVKQKYGYLSNLPDDAVTIICVPPEQEFCFAVANVLLGRINISQFYDYESYYQNFNWKDVDYPDLLIYLKNHDTSGSEYAPVRQIVNQSWRLSLPKGLRVVDWPVEGSAEKRVTAGGIMRSIL